MSDCLSLMVKEGTEGEGEVGRNFRGKEGRGREGKGKEFASGRWRVLCELAWLHNMPRRQ